MKYQIIASDLDGTLLNEDKIVSEENWIAIEEMKKMGIHFVPASGRSFGEMPKEIRESPLFRYYITSDGGLIYDKETEESLELPMPRALAHRVLDRLFSYPVCTMLHTGTNSYVPDATHNEADYRRFRMNQTWIDFTLETNIPVSNYHSFAYSCEKVQMVCAFFENQEDLNACYDAFSKDEDLLVAQSYPYNLEVYGTNCGKGNALYALADHLGIPRSATIAVGDSTNDATMVSSAGLGLAMENAMEDLKNVADRVICHHKDHCARYILENIISKK